MARFVSACLLLLLAACGVDRTGLKGPDGSVGADAPATDFGPAPDLAGIDAPATDMPLPPDMPVPTDLGPDMPATGCSVLGCMGRRCNPDDTCGVWPSCRDIHLAAGDTTTTPTGTYPIDPDGPAGMPEFMAFCEMTADSGGWTLVLKVDPTSDQFAYDGPWEDDALVNDTSLGYSLTQAKLQAYLRVPAAELRVGFLATGVMGDGSAATYAVFDPTDRTSFKQLMMMSTTPIGADTDWLRLISGSSVQTAWRSTGSRLGDLRLGLLADNVTGGSHPNSFLGLGPKQSTFYDGVTRVPAAGNYARMNTTDVTAPAWAFVFVR